MPVVQSAIFPSARSPARNDRLSRIAGPLGIVLWAVVLLVVAARPPEQDPHAGKWVGVGFNEGYVVYFWFQDRETCVAAMAGDSTACVKPETLFSEQ